jgi:aryl-alcohol dehydrogenase-like predicted oxidoreductase
MGHMQDMVKEGKIKHLAVTNFDTKNLQAARDVGINLVSNQVQFSLVDQRPLKNMAPYCQEQGVKLLAYGTVCGGFLSDKYVGRARLSRDDFDTVSKQKYYNMIDQWGGWPLFQVLLGLFSC